MGGVKRLVGMGMLVLGLSVIDGGLWTVAPAWAVTVEELQTQIDAMRRTYEAKIAALEQQVGELRQQVVSTGEQPPVATQVVREQDDEAFPYFPQNPAGFGNVTVGGYGDLEFETFNDRTSTFDQARFIINIGARPTERLMFYSEYEIEHGGVSAADVGEAKVEQAWIDYALGDLVALRGGVVLVPMGQFNLYHDSDLQDLTVRPLVHRRVIPSTWMEAGVGLRGELPVGEWFGEGVVQDLLINYQGYVVNGLDEDIGDTGLRNAKGAIEQDENANKAFVGRVGISPINNLEIGLAGYAGRYGRSGARGTANGNDGIVGFASDVNLKFGRFELVGDYAVFDFDEGAIVDNDNSDATAPSNAPGKLKGFYLEPRFHFWPSFLDDTFLGRGFEHPTFTAVSRYDWVKIRDDNDAGSGDNEENRITLGLNYRPIESFVIKTEYQWNSTDNEALEYGDSDGFAASMAIGF